MDMNPIRLLQVIPTLGCGGAERMVVNLVTHLDRKRFQVGAMVLGPAEGGTLERRLLDEGFQVWCLGKQGAFEPRTLFRIRDVVGQFGPHVVHSHLCLHYVFPALVGTPSFRHVATMHLPGNTRYSRVLVPLSRLAFRRGVVPIAVSGEVAEWVKRACGVADCQVIPNGIPVASFQRGAASRAARRREHGLSQKDVAFVCVARLEPQKNHTMLLEAFARALGMEPRAHLWLVGDGSCRAALELRARELGLEKKVRFLGQRAEVPPLLAAADAFVLASHNEGNPLALMEAMAAGLPVVATAVGGVPELLLDERSGLLVRPGDCSGFAAAMLRLFRNADLRRVMAVGSAEQARQAFSASRMGKAYMDLYERLVAGGARIAAVSRVQMATHYPS
jgi:glycosyltransferase involved in cell wall biosynthesis